MANMTSWTSCGILNRLNYMLEAYKIVNLWSVINIQTIYSLFNVRTTSGGFTHFKHVQRIVFRHLTS